MVFMAFKEVFGILILVYVLFSLVFIYVRSNKDIVFYKVFYCLV